MKRRRLLEAALVLFVISVILYIKYKILWLIIAPLGLIAIALLYKPFGDVVIKGWLFFLEIVSRIANALGMVIIFFFVLFPVAVFKRLFGKKDKSDNPGSEDEN